MCKGKWTCDLASHTCAHLEYTVVKCEDQQLCRIDTCNAKTGACELLPLPDGVGCSDGVPCTVGDACAGGSCLPGKNDCTCTVDADCNQGEPNLCTGQRFCDKAALPWTCQLNAATVVQCNKTENTACTASICVPETGECALTNLPNTTLCDWDGNACTVDKCDSGDCQPGNLAPGSKCSCTADQDCAGFEDGDACNGTLYCNKATSQCVLNPTTIVLCPSAGDTGCSTNACDPKSGQCVLNSEPDGTKCDDSLPCTSDEKCQSGVCSNVVLSCNCTETADCAAFDDSNVCNGVLYCDKLKKRCKTNPGSVVACPLPIGLTCTVSECDSKSGKCGFTAVADLTVCESDGTPCTGVDRCQNGECQAGFPLCSCDEDADCAGLSDNGACDGTMFCNKAQGKCLLNAKTAVVCSGGSACKPMVCDPKLGACATLNAADGVGCDTDDFACTADFCTAGECAAGPNACLCNVDADCQGFEDANLCNGTLACTLVNGVGVCAVDPVTVTACPDAAPNACVGQLCNPLTGSCIGTPINEGKGCDDGSGCTVDEQCATGLCAGTPLPDGASCTDGSVCTVGDACQKAVCLPGNATTCDDGLTCTKDSCSPTNGCDFKPDAAVCNDAVACTSDLCDPAQNAGTSGCLNLPNDGACAGKGVCGVGKCSVQSGCQIAADAGKCDDGIACTLEKCDLETGCSIVAVDLECDDGIACTVDSCLDATGCKQLATTSLCDDGLTCTQDTCDAKAGCTVKADDQANCSDGDICTLGDACKAGVCTTASSADCDDGDVCTADTCDAKSGCSSVSNTAPCDDGNVCTNDDKCDKGVCLSGPVTQCDDNIVCTTDSCDPTKGCEHVGNDSHCDDGNSCTDDACTTDKGCVATPSALGSLVSCYTGPKGTAGFGKCAAGASECDGKGVAGACKGDVVPEATDGCDKVDNDCDGALDEDCVEAKLTLTCGNGQTARPNAELVDGFVVTVRDLNNQPISGASVTWSSPDGGSFSLKTTTTNGSGVTVGRMKLGPTSGKVYTAVAEVVGTNGKLQVTAAASDAAPNHALNYSSFCDSSRLKVHQKAVVSGTRVTLVSGGDGQLGAVWHTAPLTPDTSFSLRADVSGYTRAYSVVLQSTSSGISKTAGGYADQNTVASNPGIVVRVEGSKGGGQFSAPSLKIAASGVTLSNKSNFLPKNQNQNPKSVWVDYDHSTKKLSVRVAAKGAAKPGVAFVTVTKDIWATLKVGGRAIYVGLTAGNSSGGANGTKYLDNWVFTYL